VFQADEGYNDDLTMTLVLFAWATNDPMFKDLMNANNRQALYSSQMKNIEDELTPFGFIDNGLSTEPEVEVIGGDIWISDKYQKDYSDFIKERNW
jgi:hypothetical protein